MDVTQGGSPKKLGSKLQIRKPEVGALDPGIAGEACQDVDPSVGACSAVEISSSPLCFSPLPPSHTHSYLVPELNQISFLRFGGSRLGCSLKSLMELVRAQRQLGPDPDLLSSDLSAWPLKIRMPPLVKEPAKALDPFTARARAIVPGVYRTCTRDRGMVCVGGGRSSQLWRVLRVFEGHSLERGGSSGLCS